MVQTPPTPVTFVVTVPTENLPAPEAANWFTVAVANQDVQLLIGYIDPTQAAQFGNAMRSGQKGASITPLVTHRIMLSLSGFSFLLTQVNDMARKMRAVGLLADETPSTKADA